MYKFKFDENKSQINQEKHGIDFTHAQQLWADPDFIEMQAKSVDEPRWLVIGLIDGKVWSAVITYRDDVIRLISVRLARKAEEDLYES